MQNSLLFLFAFMFLVRSCYPLHQHPHCPSELFFEGFWKSYNHNHTQHHHLEHDSAGAFGSNFAKLIINQGRQPHLKQQEDLRDTTPTTAPSTKSSDDDGLKATNILVGVVKRKSLPATLIMPFQTPLPLVSSFRLKEPIMTGLVGNSIDESKVRVNQEEIWFAPFGIKPSADPMRIYNLPEFTLLGEFVLAWRIKDPRRQPVSYITINFWKDPTKPPTARQIREFKFLSSTGMVLDIMAFSLRNATQDINQYVLLGYPVNKLCTFDGVGQIIYGCLKISASLGLRDLIPYFNSTEDDNTYIFHSYRSGNIILTSFDYTLKSSYSRLIRSPPGGGEYLRRSQMFIQKHQDGDQLILVLSKTIERFLINLDPAVQRFERIFTVPDNEQRIIAHSQGIERDGNLTLYLLITQPTKKTSTDQEVQVMLASFDLRSERTRTLINFTDGVIPSDCLWDQTQIVFNVVYRLNEEDPRFLTGSGPAFDLICPSSDRKDTLNFFRGEWDPLIFGYAWKIVGDDKERQVGFQDSGFSYPYKLYPDASVPDPNQISESLHYRMTGNGGDDYVKKLVEDSSKKNKLLPTGSYYGNTTFSKVIYNRAKSDYFIKGRISFPKWEWVAVAGTVLDFYSFETRNPKTQCQIFNEFTNSTDDGCQFPRPASVRFDGRAIDVLRFYAFDVNKRDNTTSFLHIKNEIDNNFPVLFERKKRERLIIGYGHDPNPNYRGVDTLILWDPVKRYQWVDFDYVRNGTLFTIRPPPLTY